MKIRAEVYGSRNNIYEQNILISTLPNGKANIVGDCSCPVAFNCKHVVAACLYAVAIQSQKSTHSQREALRWLHKFADKPSFHTEESNELLLYRLFETPYNTLSFYKTKMLKKGGYGKEYHLDPFNLLHDPYRYKYITREDISILKILKVLRKEMHPYTIELEDELGAIVLKKMIQTRRCYFGHNSKPLHLSMEPVKPEFYWEDITSKQKKIVSNLHPEGVFIPTSPMLYIDPQKNTLHEVETSYDTKSVALLMEAPVIEKEDLDLFMGKVMELIPEANIPVPQEFYCEEIKMTPVPHLRLQQEEVEGRMVHFMKLSFAYGEHLVDAYPQKSFLITEVNQKFIKIHREKAYEQAIIDELFSLGFAQSSLHNRSLFFSFANPDMQTAIERWRLFLEEKVYDLEKRGWKIIFDERFDFTFTHALDFTLNSVESETHDWFDLTYEVTLENQTIPLLPLIASVLEEFDTPQSLPPKLNLQLEDGSYLHIDAKAIAPIMQTIFELYERKEGDHIRISRFDAHLLHGFEDNNIKWKGSRELAILSQKLRNFEGITNVTPAPQLKATLREYQQFGLNWLHFLHEFQFGGILADDMGLGKTLQTLAWLQKLKTLSQLHNPVLIVMPTSLIGNWKSEIEKFTPDLTYLALYGNERAKLFTEVQNYDILLTTYQLCLRDQEKLQKMEFSCIILDEAQKIKNPKAKMTLAIKSFHAKHKLALSGTPMENHLGELWSIFDFLMPGFLGNLTFFKQQYQTPIEKNNDIARQEKLKRKIATYMLLRTKEEVLHELPEKVEIIQKVTFGKKQALLYENIRVTMEKKVSDVIKSKGLARSHITILDALLKLRQVCCDPALLSISEATKTEESAKLETLFELLEELLAEGRKILLFSQFTTMLEIIEKKLKKQKITYTKLTGQTRKREEAIARFREPDCNLFLISLKAGGVGLNLTEADTIIHYDPWWNPAVENQATDRAHRIGQTKTVFVYKLVVENSIEEKIINLQESKKELYKGLYDKGEREENTFGSDVLLELLLGEGKAPFPN
jgi:superfamily II DNA or RNA helicase